MDDLRYQLVIQFKATASDEERFRTLTWALEEPLAAFEDVVVDGWDFGLGKFNIFIHTNTPEEDFLIAKYFIQVEEPDETFISAYRDVSEDNFVILWPPGLKTFELM